MQELIQKILDLEEAFFNLKVELLGEPTDSIDTQAASGYIADMQTTLDDISNLHLS